jgi:hypothetical protein
VEGDRVRMRRVDVGIRAMRSVEVVSGLADGDRVASPVSASLIDGRRVRVTDRRQTGS